MKPQTSPISLVTTERAHWSLWLERMEAAFMAGLRDAGLQPGEEPIPKQDEMREVLNDPPSDVLQVMQDGATIGGVVIAPRVISPHEEGRRSLELFFIDAGHQGRGTGAQVWKAIEARYPDTTVWETETPYFEQRNIHFYINTCGFQAVEFFHPGHPREEEDSSDFREEDGAGIHPGPDRSFRFEKKMTTRLLNGS